MTLDIDLIRRIEEISLNAWAAPYQLVYDGWLLRYAEGYTRRANSTHALYPSNISLEEKVAFCEAFYEQRALPTTFKMTHAAQPPELDEYLAELDYTVVAHTHVKTLSLRETAYPKPPNLTVDTRTHVNRFWLELFYEIDRTRLMYQPIAQKMLQEHLIAPAFFVSIWEDLTPIAAALMVMEHGYAGIFDVGVHTDWRGRGYGRKLMQYLLWLAQLEGAHTIYLQVMFNNKVARHLYDSMGFVDLYRYWYRQKPIPV